MLKNNQLELIFSKGLITPHKKKSDLSNIYSITSAGERLSKCFYLLFFRSRTIHIHKSMSEICKGEKTN